MRPNADQHYDDLVVAMRDRVDRIDDRGGRWARFWSHVAIRDIHECWDWQAATVHGGYGQSVEFGGEVRAHRIAYLFARGPIPPGMLVLHSCDRAICVNPRHLRVGTAADNALDADIARWMRAAKQAAETGVSIPSRSDVAQGKVRAS